MSANSHDFDFLFGTWTVRHRRLKERLKGSADWEDFTGTCTTRPILGGAGNIEEHEVGLPSSPYRAIALRSFNTGSDLWSIWWLDQRFPHTLDAPVVGRFTDGIGVFETDDVFEGQPIKIRFEWNTNGAGDSPEWQQSFSPDGGVAWEPNWQMRFEKTG